MPKVTAIIPTFARGTRCFGTIGRLLACKPQPLKILVHVDQSDGELEMQIASRFPQVVTLSSKSRLGPGGGRHRCLLACQTEFAASFDDDSWPVDEDYFARIVSLFKEKADAAILGATIWHRGELPVAASSTLIAKQAYVGCGCVFRLDAYRETRGLLPRPVPYGGEETDLSLQLSALSWRIYHSGQLRVYHDTDLKHHDDAFITSGTVANIGLFAYLHYPLSLFPLGLIQLANMVSFNIKRGRRKGLASGIASVPIECFRYRKLRKPLSKEIIMRYRRDRT